MTEPTITRLSSAQPDLFYNVLEIFAEVFDEDDFFRQDWPSQAYLAKLLGSDHFIALLASIDGEYVGALTAYVQVKYEQERTEIHILDLAVRDEARRKRAAAKMIAAIGGIAKTINCWNIFVQTDFGDAAAISLYERFGNRTDIIHFDIPISRFE